MLRPLNTPAGDAVAEYRRLSVAAGTCVADVVEKMKENNAGAIGILHRDSGELVGLFTERHYLRNVIGERLDPARTPVETVMRERPATVMPEAPLYDCISTMAETWYRFLPVIEHNDHGQKFHGILAMRDLL